MKLHSTHLVSIRQRGFTLVEMALSVSLLGVVMGLATMVTDSARGAYESASASMQTQAEVKIVLDRVATEIKKAALGTLDPALDGVITDTNQISLMQVVDIVAGVPVMGDVLTVRYVADPRDAVDGADNDGDGLIDEGHLVMVRDAGGLNPQTVTLCRNVRRFLEGEEAGAADENGNGLNNESGFLIQRDGDLLTIQITVERPRRDGATSVETSTTSVMLRN